MRLVIEVSGGAVGAIGVQPEIAGLKVLVFDRDCGKVGEQTIGEPPLYQWPVMDEDIRKAVAAYDASNPPKDIGELVVEALRKAGIDASWEYPGFISIDLSDGGIWSFGTNNPTWCGDVMDSLDRSQEGVDLEIKSDSQDVEAIREAIIKALDDYNQSHGTSYNRC